MLWELSHRADTRARLLADRHYNRQKIGSPQFVPPGRCHVLYHASEAGEAFWVTSWPFGEYVKHRWPGAWVCSAFRSEAALKATDFIRDALAASRARYDVPDLGMVTFINPKFVRPTIVRGKLVYGWTWLKAGFEPDGETKGGLLAFRYPGARIAAEIPAAPCRLPVDLLSC